MEEYLTTLSTVFNFILSFFLIILVFLLLIELFLSKNKKNLKIFGIFMGLSNKDILALSLTTVKYIFIIWCLFSKDISIFHLLFIVGISMLYSTIYLDVKNFIWNIINGVFIYFALLSKMIFYNYLLQVGGVWYVIIILIFLVIFIFIYNSYFFIKDIDYILKKNKYIKKVIKN